MKQKVYYKIVNVKDDTLRFLFHGVDNSKTIEPNKWYVADKKMVIDGTNGTQYLSGFHILETIEEAEKYLTNFSTTDNKRIVEVLAKDIRKKEHSRSEVFLADEILFLN